MRPNLQSYQHVASGKVREIYEIDADTLLLVATDRISAYDHILQPAIRDKGRILTAMSFFWFDVLGVPNHLAGGPTDERIPADVVGRSMVVHKLPMVQVECVARGYLTGSGLLDYRATGSVCGIALPEGLDEAHRLPEPIFTPATKAELGDHDENVDFDRAAEIVGDRHLMEELRRISIEIYEYGANHAAEKGIILADTKFEFGSYAGAEIVLGDEVLTPDSSRYWPADQYEPGKSQPSFDKQYVRDWANAAGWDHNPPAPELPEDVVAQTQAKYREAYERITGREL